METKDKNSPKVQEKIFLSASDWWLLGEKIWEKEQLKNVMSCMSERFQEQWVLYCEEVAVISKDDFLFIYIYRGELLLAILTFSISCEKKILTRSERKYQEAIYVWKKMIIYINEVF